MYIKKSTLVVGAMLLVLITVFLSIGAVNPFGFTAYRDLLHFQYVSNLIMNSYYEDIDPSVYMQYALEGVAKGTKDPYTSYFWGSDAIEYREKLQGNYKGIGVQIFNNTEDNTIEILSVIPDSPAEQAGVISGDKIIKVDGVSYTGLQLGEATSKIRGADDTEVVISILKKQDGKMEDITLKRREIDMVFVSGKMVQNDIGLIKIAEFTNGSVEKFQKAYDELKTKGMKKLILDLRDNPGGLLDEASEIADIFLEEGKVIVYTLDRYDNKEEYYATEGKEEIPMVILTNNASASASEAVTGCLKDHGVAYHIGEKTYGKGVVQGVCYTGGESLLSVTISRYFTPNGVCIHQKGIVPDQEVILPPERSKNISKLSLEEDLQLQAAISYLNQ